MNKLFDITKYIHQAIWHENLKSAPLWKRFIFSFLRISYAIVRDIKEGQLSLRAMSLVYTTVISLVPLLAISFSVLKGFGVHNQIEPALIKILEPLGEKKNEIIEKIIQFVDNIQVGLLGTLGFALLIYSVISMMQKIERSFNYIWHVNRGRNVAQRFSDYLSVLLVGPLLIFLSIGVTVSLSSVGFVSYMSELPVLGHIISVIGHIIPYFIMAIAFAFIYLFVPNTSVNFNSAFVGGIVTALIWKGMGWVFATFVASSTSGTIIYSAFATLLLFMIWLHLGWLVLLIGSSIAFYHQHPNNMLLNRNKTELSNCDKEKIGLLIVQKIARNFQKGLPPYTSAQIANEIGIPQWAADIIIKVFIKTEILLETNTKPPGYVPSKPLEEITVCKVLEAIRENSNHGFFKIRKINSSEEVDKCFDEINKTLSHCISQKNLKDLLDETNHIKN